MKYSLTLSLFLGLLTQEAAAMRLQRHHHHHHGHHKPHFVQIRTHDDDELTSSDTHAWVKDCQPGRDPYSAGNGNAGVNAAYPGVGITCQGFAQIKSREDGDELTSSDTNAWVKDCQPGRDPYSAGNGNAGVNAAYPGVGIKCQGFAQVKSKGADAPEIVLPTGGTNAWVDDCQPGRDPYSAGNGNAGVNAAYPGVGISCQGFAQVRSREEPAPVVLPSGGNDAWVDKCDPAQDTTAQKNPSGAGTYEEGQKGSFPGVGVDCQGFAQIKSKKRDAPEIVLPSGGTNAWVDDCQPGRDPYSAGNGNAGVNAAYPGVGIDCQGFTQKRGCPAGLPECNGTNGKQGVDCC